MTRRDILRVFGPDGVSGLEPWSVDEVAFARGSYTDDTQMMLATARACLDAASAWRQTGILDVEGAAYGRYLEWYQTQDDPDARRRPGVTCLTALGSGDQGCMDDPINDRKGSGGIMRVTPIGVAFAPERAFEIAAEVAAVTHGHPAGFLSAGVFADVLSRAARGQGLPDAVADARETLLGFEDVDETLDALDRAVELYISDIHPVEGVQHLGEGWVAEEALAIAVFCALSYPEDWERGTLAAVNITGDSDTTGCLTGALLGASLGESALPLAWLDELEDAAEIAQLAGDVWNEFVGRAVG
jgi:ADP-ribosylglycohydrolase